MQNSVPASEPVSEQVTAPGPPRKSWLWTIITWIDVLFWLSIVVPPAFVLGLWARIIGDRRRYLASRVLAAAFRAIVRVHPRYRLTMSGLTSLPKGSALLCANHQSLSDVVFLFSLPCTFRWIVKDEFFGVPGFGVAMTSAGYLRIRRGDPVSARLLLDGVQASFADGMLVLSFPEGTRSRDGDIGPFSLGAARMAIAAQVPLVPIGVAGTDWVLPRGSGFYSRDAHVVIHVGEPISTEGLTRRDARHVTARLREAVIAAKQTAQAQSSLAPKNADIAR